MLGSGSDSSKLPMLVTMNSCRSDAFLTDLSIIANPGKPLGQILEGQQVGNAFVKGEEQENEKA
jgi:hypothetical protein